MLYIKHGEEFEFNMPYTPKRYTILTTLFSGRSWGGRIYPKDSRISSIKDKSLIPVIPNQEAEVRSVFAPRILTLNPPIIKNPLLEKFPRLQSKRFSDENTFLANKSLLDILEDLSKGSDLVLSKDDLKNVFKKVVALLKNQKDPIFLDYEFFDVCMILLRQVERYSFLLKDVVDMQKKFIRREILTCLKEDELGEVFEVFLSLLGAESIDEEFLVNLFCDFCDIGSIRDGSFLLKLHNDFSTLSSSNQERVDFYS